MSFGGLMEGLVNKLLTFYDSDINTAQSVRWTSVESRFLNLLESLQNVRFRRDTRECANMLNDLMVVLEKHKFTYDTEDLNGDRVQFNRVRSILLDLWNRLLRLVIANMASQLGVVSNMNTKIGEGEPLDMLKSPPQTRANPNAGTNTPSLAGSGSGSGSTPQSASHPPPILTLNDSNSFYKAIGFLMARREFAPQYLQLNEKNEIKSTNVGDINIAMRYRTMLFQTQAFVQRCLVLVSRGSKPLGHSTYAFFARVLAVSCFRLPAVSRLLISAVIIDDAQYESIAEFVKIEEDVEETPEMSFSRRGDIAIAKPKETENSLNEEDNGQLENQPIDEIEQTRLDDNSDTDSINDDNSTSTSNTIIEDIELSDSLNKEDSLAASIDLSTDDEKIQENVASSDNSSNTNNAQTKVNSQITKLDLARNRIKSVSNIVVTATPPSPRTAMLLSYAKTYPILFDWARYHAALAERANDREDEKLQQGGGEWLAEMKKKEILFYFFIHNWVQHVVEVVGPSITHFKWSLLKGYNQFVPSFIYSMKMANVITRAITDCSCSLLITNPSLINFYINHTFSKTNAHATMQVLDTLSLVEMWLKELMKYELTLGDIFDHHFFVKGLTIMFNTEHHQLLSRALSILFNCAEIFVEEARKAIFIDLLLHKWFFHFFLHWDPNVRNIFHQIVVFKMIRMKRSELSERRSHLLDGPQMMSTETITDTVIYGKIESLLRMMTDQLENPNEDPGIPKNLVVYIPRALDEYRDYITLYHKWEREGSTQQPKLVSHSLMHRGE